MKIVYLLFFLFISSYAMSQYDSSAFRAIDTLKVADRIFTRHDGRFRGIIVHEHRPDSIVFLTNRGLETFDYHEIKKIEFNIAKKKYKQSLYLRRDSDDYERPRINPEAFILRPIDRSDVRKRLIGAVVISASGAVISVAGAGLLGANLYRSRHYSYNSDYMSSAIAGAMVLAGGIQLGIGSIPLWATWVKKRRAYQEFFQPKRQ